MDKKWQVSHKEEQRVLLLSDIDTEDTAAVMKPP